MPEPDEEKKRSLLEVKDPYLQEFIDLIPGHDEPRRPFLRKLVEAGLEKDLRIHKHFENIRFDIADTIYSYTGKYKAFAAQLAAELSQLSKSDEKDSSYSQLAEKAKISCSLGSEEPPSLFNTLLVNLDKYAYKVSRTKEIPRCEDFMQRFKERLPEEPNLENRIKNLRGSTAADLIDTFSGFAKQVLESQATDPVLEDLFRISIGDLILEEKLKPKCDALSRTITQESTYGLMNLLKLFYGQEELARLKFGVDPTFTELHLGHVVVLNKIRQFQEIMGYNVDLIIGDHTAMIGDPTGRSSSRKQLTAEEVYSNMANYKPQVLKFLIPEKTSFVPNSTWLSALSLAEYGEMISKINLKDLLRRKDFRARLASPSGSLTMLELSYPSLQAFDSVAIDADIEFGGNDQRPNCMLGRDLQEKVGLDSQLVILTPLLVGIDGVHKMSKSRGNHIGINEPADAQYQKLMKLRDWAVRDYFELLTTTPHEQVNEYMRCFNEKKLIEDRGNAFVSEYSIHPFEFKRREIIEFMGRTPDITLDEVVDYKGSIMIVGDHVQEINQLRSALRNQGYSVVVADPRAEPESRRSAEHAMGHFKFDYIIEGLNDIEESRRIAQLANGSVHLISIGEGEKQKELGKPTASYFTRPLKLEQLAKKVSQVIAEHKNDKIYALESIEPLLLDIESMLKRREVDASKLDYKLAIGHNGSFTLTSINRYTKRIFDSMEKTDPAKYDPLKVKQIMAEAVVSQYHGAETARKVAEEFDRIHFRKELPKDLETIAVNSYLKEEGISFVELLANAYNVSKGEARRLMDQNALSLNDQKIPGDILRASDYTLGLKETEGTIVKVGKREPFRLVYEQQLKEAV